MMGIGAPGEVGDMLSMCSRPVIQIVPRNRQLNLDDFISEEVTREGMVTGFTGPFEGQQENPSSVIIDELEKEGVENKQISLYKLETTYQEVSKRVPELWKEQRRDFSIHIAPHSIKNRIYLEQRAFSNGYLLPDSTGFIPEGNKITCESEETEIKFEKNCDELAKELNEKCGLNGEKFGGLLVEKSEDPERFVEGFTYFLSLHENRWLTILVKIPPFEGEITKEVVTSVIRELIKLAF